MGNITEYLLSITAAVIVCAIAKQIVGEKSSMAKIVKVVAGVFVAVTMISPLVNIQFDDFTDSVEQFVTKGESVTASGTKMANEAMTDIIKEQLEAYILDEADRLSLHVSAQVSLKSDSTFLPEMVTISGAVSPYQKNQLSQFIEERLGVARENQKWI